ncbi:hypothetical protein JCM8097_000042 [Rhodosporidiobolus ruineniae]
MPVYKQIAKQQKRAKRKVEALLSDEESGSSDSEQSDASAPSDDDADSDDGSDDDEDDEDEEDDGLGGAGEAPLDEDAPRPPPVGFPTAQQALDNPVASTASLIAAMKVDGEDEDGSADEEDDEDAPLVCVFCPNKVLKKGKMTEVHLASKDHKRRLARFKAHLDSPNFPAEHLLADARWVASQLDKAVLERLSLQTQVGGKKAGTVKPNPKDPFFALPADDSTATPSKPTASAKKGKGKATPSAADTPSKPSTSSAAAPSSSSKPASRAAKEAAVAAAEAAGTSVREQLRQQKKDKADEKKRMRKEAKKDKNERIKRRKVEAGETVTPHIPSKPKFVEKIKPTEEEIQARQAWKKARDEAKAKGLPAPPRPVLAYEHGGKVPAKKGKAAAGAAAKGGKKKGGEKPERVVNEARLAKRQERKVRRKAEKAEAKAKAEADAPLPEL